MIVNSGLEFFPALIAAGGESLTFSSKIGTNSTATTSGMTALLAQIAEKEVDTLQAVAGSYTYDALSAITAHGPGGTYTVREMGLFVNETMFSRVVVNTAKLDGEYIKTDFKEIVGQGTSDGLMPIVGREFLPRYCAAGGGAVSVSVKIGTGTAALSISSTDLAVPVATDSAPTVSSNGATLYIAAHFGPSGAYTIQEYGYFLTAATPGTALKQRWLGPPLTKADGDYVTIYMDDTFEVL